MLSYMNILVCEDTLHYILLGEEEDKEDAGRSLLKQGGFLLDLVT